MRDVGLRVWLSGGEKATHVLVDEDDDNIAA